MLSKAMIILAFLLGIQFSAAAPGEWPISILESTSKEPKSRSSTEPEMQEQISSAMMEIMSTTVGKAICRNILTADPIAIEYHLGVDKTTAVKIAAGCTGTFESSWVSPSPHGQIEKLSVNGSGKRTYVFVINGDSIPFDSWTEPFSNTTVFVVHSKRDKPVNRQRLIQLLAHETAVYFDSKAMIGHGDAMSLPELRELQLVQSGTSLNPRIAAMNPIIAHTLTFVRALHVEREIVKELVARKVMEWPEEYKDPLIKELLSDECGNECLASIVEDMSEIYLPLALPLVALSPTYRIMKQPEAYSLRASHPDKWKLLSAALDEYPRRYVQQLEILKQKPFMELIEFFAHSEMSGTYAKVEAAFRTTLWPEDWNTVLQTRVASPVPSSFLEFMKRPLLSGYNILLSNGPRVRIRAGDSL